MSEKTYGPVRGKSLDTPVYGGVNNLAREKWAEEYSLHTRQTNRQTTKPVEHLVIASKTLALILAGLTLAKFAWWVWFVI